MKASTNSIALATSCVLALAASPHPASAWQEERVPTLEIASEEQVEAWKAAEAAGKANAERDKYRNIFLIGPDCARKLRELREEPNLDSSPLYWNVGDKAVKYVDEACELIEEDEFVVMSGSELERLRRAKIESDKAYYAAQEYLVLKNGSLFRLDRATPDEDTPDDFSEDPEGSDDESSDADQGADGASLDDFDEDPEGSDDDTEPADDSTAGSTVDPDAVIPPQRTGATGLSGQFETSNENGIIFGEVIWWLYGPGGVEVQNYRRNQLLVDLVPGATYRVVAKELGENGRTAELTFTPQGTGFTFTRGLRFQ